MREPERRWLRRRGRRISGGWCLAAVAIAALAAAPRAAHGDVQTEDAKLTASDATAADRFGSSVAMNGGAVVVGAPFAEGGAVDSGAVYVFERDPANPAQWLEASRLTASDAASGGLFGMSVAIEGDTLIIGASGDPGAGSNSGAAYVFQRGTGNDDWGEVTKITASDGQAFTRFGTSVALSGDTVLVGASGTGGAAPNGAVYVFERNAGGPEAWGQVKKLTASDGASGDEFGVSVALSGDTALAGARFDDSSTGAAYLFERDAGGAGQWGETAKLTASDAAPSMRFGRSVAIQGSRLVVGSLGLGAYVFERDPGGVWSETAHLVTVGGEEFGYAVALDGDTVLVGARLGSANGTRPGSAHEFRQDPGSGIWSEITKLVPSDGALRDQLGAAVAVAAGTVVAGAPNDDGLFIDPGAAYIFELVPAAAPSLALPADTAVAAGDAALLPITFTGGGAEIASVAFSLDYDESCLGFDPADGNGDGIPDALGLSLPPGFTATIFHDPADGDGELDVLVFSSPVAALPDGPVGSVTFTTLCAAPTGGTVTAPVLFSTSPAASFGDIAGQDVAGTATGGIVTLHGGSRGDANGNDSVTAADVSALVLEIFDGDGSFWLDVPGGTFPGTPVGCDANADTAVDAGDLSCIGRLIFGLACGAALGEASLAGEDPWLWVPHQLPVAPDGTVTAPVHFDPGAHAINSLAWSLDLDLDRLAFDPTDADGDGLPDAVRFAGGFGTLRSAVFDPADPGGELDLVLADLSASPQALPGGAAVEVDLQLLGSAPAVEHAVSLAPVPHPSFGDVQGRGVAGAVALFVDGFEDGDLGAWSSHAP